MRGTGYRDGVKEGWKQQAKDLIDRLWDVVDEAEDDDHSAILEAVKTLDPTRTISFKCCSLTVKVPAEDIYANCPECDRKIKIRRFGADWDYYDILLVAREYFNRQRKELVSDD